MKIEKLNQINKWLRLALTAIIFSVLSFMPVQAILQNDASGPDINGSLRVDKSNAPGGFVIENAQYENGSKIEGGLILIDSYHISNPDTYRAIVNVNGELMVNIDGNGTLQKILLNGDVINTGNGGGSGGPGIDLSNGGDLNGTINFVNAEVNGNLLWNGGTFTYRDGTQGVDYILTSDIDGNARWSDPCSMGLCGGGGINGAGLEVTSLTPSNGAIGVDKNANLEVRFNTIVIPASSGTVSLKRYSNDSTVYNFDINSSSQITVNANKLIIDPPGALQEDEHYYVTVTPNAIVSGIDTSNKWNGFTLKDEWDFNTGSELAVSSRSPADNATLVAKDTSLSITFDKATAIGSGFVYIKNADGDTDVAAIDVNDTGRVSLSGDLRTVSITLPTNLEYGEDYYVLIDSGTFVSASSTSIVFLGYASSTQWNFSTRPKLDIVSFLPPDNGTDVSLDAVFTIDFNLPISKVANKYLKVKRVSDNALIDNLDVASLTPSGTSVNFDPSPSFEFLTDYYIELESGAFRDSVDITNTNAGFNGNTYWNFRSRPVDNLAAITRSPSDNEQDVDNGSSLSITFNVPMFLDTGNGGIIEVRDYGDDSLFESFAMSNGRTLTVSPDNLTLTINPDNAFSFSGRYYVLIPSGVIDNLNNPADSFTGYSSKNQWDFNTISQLYETNKVPSDSQTNISRTPSLYIDFSTGISLGSGNIRVRQVSDDATVETIPIGSTSISGGGSDRLNIGPLSTLDYLTTYYIEMDSGAVVNSLDAGDQFVGYTGSSDWSFTTVPGISENSRTPDDDASGVNVDTNININFTHNVHLPGGFQATLRDSLNNIVESFDLPGPRVNIIGGNTVSFNPTNDLNYEETYYMLIPSGAIVNDSDHSNEFTGYSSSTEWDFTTQNVPLLALSSVSPLNNSSNISKDTNILLNFNQAVDQGTGLVLIKDSNDITIHSINISDASQISLADNDKQVVINPSSDLSYNEIYYIEIPNGAIVNKLKPSDTFTGFSGPSAWTFQTELGLQLSSTNPSSGSPNVGRTDSISMNFNIAVNRTSGNVTIRRDSDDAIIDQFDIGSSQVTLTNSNRTVIIDPAPNANIIEAGFFDYATTYYVEIASGALENAADATNDFPGFTGSSGWNFTTESAVPISVVNRNPDTGTSNVALDGTFSIVFNVPVVFNMGNVSFIDNGANTLESFDITTGKVTLSGDNKTVTLDPDNDYLCGKTYSIRIADDAIRNSFNTLDHFDGYTSNEWSFSTPACAPPPEPETETINLPNTNTVQIGNSVLNNSVTQVILRNKTLLNEPVVLVNIDTGTDLPTSLTIYPNGYPGSAGTTVNFPPNTPDSSGNKYTVPDQYYSLYFSSSRVNLQNELQPDFTSFPPSSSYKPMTVEVTYIQP